MSIARLKRAGSVSVVGGGIWGPQYKPRRELLVTHRFFQQSNNMEAVADRPRKGTSIRAVSPAEFV